MDITNKRYQNIPITINDKVLPHSNTAKHLGMSPDAKLRWKAHIKKKCKELELKYKKMYWLMRRRSALSIHNKLMLYKQILKSVLTYGTQLWGCKKKSNTDIIQRFQNKVLRNIVDAPWHMRSADLHSDLQMEMVTNEIGKFFKKHEERLLPHHVDVEAIQLLDNSELI